MQSYPAKNVDLRLLNQKISTLGITGFIGSLVTNRFSQNKERFMYIKVPLVPPEHQSSLDQIIEDEPEVPVK